MKPIITIVAVIIITVKVLCVFFDNASNEVRSQIILL